MRIVLDENLPRNLIGIFSPGHRVATVQSLGLAGTANGALIARMEGRGEAAEDRDELGRRPPVAPRAGAGEGVEDAPAVAAAVVQDRGAVAAVVGHAVVLQAPGAGQAGGVEPAEDEPVAGLFVHQLVDGEIHRGRLGGGGSVGPGQDGRKAALLEEAGHQKPHMSRYTFRRS